GHALMAAVGQAAARPPRGDRIRATGLALQVLIVFLMAGLAGAACAADTLPRAGLILGQFRPGLLEPGYAEMAESFRTSLLPRSHIRIYAENLDLNTFSDPRYETKLQDYLRDKYHDAPIGVLLAVGSSALEFALQLRAERWPDVPIVFAA